MGFQDNEIRILARALELKADEMGHGVKTSLLSTLSVYKDKADQFDTLKQNHDLLLVQMQELELIRESNNQELVKSESDLSTWKGRAE